MARHGRCFGDDPMPDRAQPQLQLGRMARVAAALFCRASRVGRATWMPSLYSMILLSISLIAGEPVSEIKGFKGTVRYLSYSPDGNRLAVSDEGSGFIHIVAVGEGKREATFGDTPSDGAPVFWTADGSNVLSHDGNAWTQWDVASKARRYAVPAETSGLRSLTVSPDGKYLVVGGTGVVKIWEVASRIVIGSAEPIPNYSIRQVAISPDGRRLAVAALSTTVATLTLPAATDAKTFELPNKASLVAFSANGLELLCSDPVNELHQIDLASGKDRVVNIPGGPAEQMAVSADGKWIALAGGVRLRMLQRSNSTWHQIELQKTALGAACLAFSRDSKTIAVGDHEARVRRWSLWDFQPIKP